MLRRLRIVHQVERRQARRLLFFQCRAQCLLRMASGGDILGKDHDASDAPVGSTPGANFPAGPDCNAVAAHEGIAVRPKHLAGQPAPMSLLPFFLQVREDLVMRLADHVLAGLVEKCQPGLADGQIVHSTVEQCHRKRRMVDEQA
ncbi:hypothetical protein SDC9_207416 [bioreactor metagenome]|uniref:Uncharacterized protein n=1 Tax=bioreactor metagenome TaxID=1076179 RepID=A0A645JH66_9ZZZZ